MVLGFTRPHYMVVLFAVITGMTLWEFSGLVNDQKGISVNRFISTAAGVYFFVAVAGQRMGFVEGFSAYIPYILSIIYLFIAELYLKNENPLHCWAYTMLGQMYIALPFSMVNVLAFQTTPEGMLTVDMLLPLSVFVLLGPMILEPIVLDPCWESTSSFHASALANPGREALVAACSCCLSPT